MDSEEDLSVGDPEEDYGVDSGVDLMKVLL